LSATNPEILNLAELALKSIFRPHIRKQDEIFDEAGQLVKLPVCLCDSNKSDGRGDNENDNVDASGNGSEKHDVNDEDHDNNEQDDDGEIPQVLDGHSTDEDHQSEHGPRCFIGIHTSMVAQETEVYEPDGPAAPSSTGLAPRRRLSDIGMDDLGENLPLPDGMLPSDGLPLSDDMLSFDNMFDQCINGGSYE